MSVFLYNIFLWLFRAGMHIAALFNPKARKWVQGRKGLIKKIAAAVKPGEKIIWVHCASLGEFEQGRPVMETIRKEYPRYKILLTFFSPSGYEAQQHYKGADYVFYLPMDSPANARKFLEIIQPSLVIFVKYEFWYYYLKKIKYRAIPLILISALFRKDMSFFKWYGGIQRKILSRFDRLFVQNESSAALLKEIGLDPITTISGDTRFDRVLDIAKHFEPVPALEKFAAGSKLLVAGSTWEEDEELLAQSASFFNKHAVKLVIAPHEISSKNIDAVRQKFPGAALYSELPADTRDISCLIIDNIGMLSRLYKYGYACFVGGGLKQEGVHNVLEAAVYYKPVLFGPFYKKYAEATGLVEHGGAFPVKNTAELVSQLGRLITDPAICEEAKKSAGDFVSSHSGAVKKIMDYIQQKRLLTN